MTRKVLAAVVLLVAVVAVVAGIKVMQIRSMIAAGESFVMPPETVSSTTVRRVEWATSDSAVGTVAAAQGVHLKAEVAGIVERIGFQSGADVRKGDVLVELDASQEEADLSAAVARWGLAKSNLQRARDLHRQEILSKSELDAREAEYREITSGGDAIRVAIEKKKIRAPFAGRAGIRQVQLGELVEPGTDIVTLQTVDPVHVDFTLPERSASRVKAGMAVQVSTDAAAGRTFEGRLTAVSPEIDPATRHLALQATLPNTDGALVPGMFVRVEVMRDERIRPLVVPVTAVLRAPYGDSVFVLKDEKDEKGNVAKRAAMTTVTLGETRGDFVVVETGLEEGQEIASSGVFKLTNGAAVAVNNELAPPAEVRPQPQES